MSSDPDIFVKNIIHTNVKLFPINLHKNFREKLLSKLKNTFENKYSKYGLIKENSIEIIKSSIGSLEQNSLEGNVIYNVQFSALVCNPGIGNIIKCKVVNQNNFGILCTDFKYSIISIIVPKKTLAIQSDISLNNINIDDIVYIEIVGKKALLNDTKINCIGRIKRTNNINNNKNNSEKDNTILLEKDEEYDNIIEGSSDEDDDDDDDDEDIIEGGDIDEGLESDTCESLLSISDLSDNLSDDELFSD
jgi:DNA-directed RNA polymerase subunit E'/Rpb7